MCNDAREGITFCAARMFVAGQVMIDGSPDGDHREKILPMLSTFTTSESKRSCLDCTSIAMFQEASSDKITFVSVSVCRLAR